MDKDLARCVIRAGFANMRELTNLLDMLKANCDADEHQPYLKAVATVCAHIGQEIIDRAVAAYPELEAEIDAKI